MKVIVPVVYSRVVWYMLIDGFEKPVSPLSR
jgi:hypothetical protein